MMPQHAISVGVETERVSRGHGSRKQGCGRTKRLKELLCEQYCMHLEAVNSAIYPKVFIADSQITT